MHVVAAPRFLPGGCGLGFLGGQWENVPSLPSCVSKQGVVDDTENENVELSPLFSSSSKEGKGGEELKGTVQKADLITLIFIWVGGG